MIYILCPPDYATGGVELLHQLCAEIRAHGQKCFIWYPDFWFPDISKNPTPKEYAVYGNEYVVSSTPPKNTVVIVPEIYAGVAAQLERPVVFWESVDNYTRRFGKNVITPPHTIHLTQSEYARDFLEKNGVWDPIPVTDYLNDDFFKAMPKMKRDPVVLYNPAKGLQYTRRVMEFCDGIQFYPIENMSRADVIQLMCRSMVYIDFGDHPGKDRLPREAAMCGMIVITGWNGSAAFREDVNIPVLYKIERERTYDASQLIKRCLRDYDKLRRDFLDYRASIYGEKERFREGVRIFIDVVLNNHPRI